MPTVIVYLLRLFPRCVFPLSTLPLSFCCSALASDGILQYLTDESVINKEWLQDVIDTFGQVLTAQVLNHFSPKVGGNSEGGQSSLATITKSSVILQDDPGAHINACPKGSQHFRSNIPQRPWSHDEDTKNQLYSHIRETSIGEFGKVRPPGSTDW